MKWKERILVLPRVLIGDFKIPILTLKDREQNHSIASPMGCTFLWSPRADNRVQLKTQSELLADHRPHDNKK